MNQTNKKALIERLTQQIEIISLEIKLLQSLIVNSKSETIRAPSYLAVNLSDNSIILEKNSETIYPIASITKLMTAVITFENIPLDQEITLTKDMLLPFGYSPSLYLGAKVQVKDLLKASLIQSTNDAAEALSYFIGKEKFLKLMNKKTKELGMNNTIFYDSSGLNPENYSTASDLVRLLDYIYRRHPEILTITKDNNFWLPDEKGRLLKFRNLNDFYFFANFLGGKTGFLPEAKQTFASIFKVNENPIAIVLLFSDNHQADTFAILKEIKKNEN